MDKAAVEAKVKTLTEEAQKRANTIVSNDPAWQNIQGQIGTWEEVLKDLNGTEED